MVDRSVRDSLDKEEVRRQGLWWELINGEREYVRDLKIICVVSSRLLDRLDSRITFNTRAICLQ